MRSCLIADDHGLMRDALAATVAARWPSASIVLACDFPTAWAAAAAQPELCLADLDMPGALPLDGVAGLHAAAPGMKILVVTGSLDDGIMQDLLARGVAGFAPKTLEAEVLGAAIALVLAGGRYLPPRLAELAISAPPQVRATPLPRTLSARQIEVVKLIALGSSNKDIARLLGVTPATIKTHVAQTISILGAINRTDAATRAGALGLL